MTNDEWDVIVAALVANWPQAVVPESSLAKWKTDLDDLPPAAVLRAVESIYRTGTPFVPNGAQIRLEAQAVELDAPEWSVVWLTLLDGVARFPLERGQAMREWLADEHSLLAAMYDRIDWREFRFGESERTVLEAQTRGKWEALVARVERNRALDGLPIPPALDGGGKGPRRIGAILRALPGGRDE